MAINLVQHKANFQTNSSSDTLSITINATGLGNLIIVMSGTNASKTTGSVSDNATGGSNTYFQVQGAQSTFSTGSLTQDMWYAKNSKRGATTVTITRSPTGGTSNIYGFVYEVSGMDIISPVVHVANVLNNGTATLTLTGASVTTKIANTFIATVAYIQQYATGIHSGNEFTIGDIQNGNPDAYLIAKNAAPHTAIFDVTPTGSPYCCSTVAFRGIAKITDMRKHYRRHIQIGT
jgi:hypothetical protein